MKLREKYYNHLESTLTGYSIAQYKYTEKKLGLCELCENCETGKQAMSNLMKLLKTRKTLLETTAITRFALYLDKYVYKEDLEQEMFKMAGIRLQVRKTIMSKKSEPNSYKVLFSQTEMCEQFKRFFQRHNKKNEKYYTTVMKQSLKKGKLDLDVHGQKFSRIVFHRTFKRFMAETYKEQVSFGALLSSRKKGDNFKTIELHLRTGETYV